MASLFDKVLDVNVASVSFNWTGCQDRTAKQLGGGKAERATASFVGLWWLLMGCSLVQRQPGVYTETAFNGSHPWRLMSAPHSHMTVLH